MNYHDLEIWKLAHDLVIEIHNITLHDIPKFEFYETGSQIRRSVKSVKANIVEGYGRRYYKNDFVHFLVIAQASLDETNDHFDTLFDTKSFKNELRYHQLKLKIAVLGRKLYLFTLSVRREQFSFPK